MLEAHGQKCVCCCGKRGGGGRKDRWMVKGNVVFGLLKGKKKGMSKSPYGGISS